MNCQPSKNERCRCEPFVWCMNTFYSRQYRFDEIPDLLDRTCPKPDARYLDEINGESLIIERKSVSYYSTFAPYVEELRRKGIIRTTGEEYTRRHEFDHLIMDFLGASLPEEITSGRYVFKMPWLHFAPARRDVIRHAKDICAYIQANLDRLRKEGGLSFHSVPPCAGEYVLYKKDEACWDELENGSLDGLSFSLIPKGNRIGRFDWDGLDQSEVPVLISQILKTLPGKFAEYPHASKVLLIERFGDISGPLDDAFTLFIERIEKPAELNEIWDGWIETPDFDDPHWVYSRLWSRSNGVPEGWSKPEICCKVKCHCHVPEEDADVFWM